MIYTTIKKDKVYYNGVNLERFAKTNELPAKIVFLDIIEKQIEALRKIFLNTVNAEAYNGDFLYINANKANYASEIAYTAAKLVDGIEVSSIYDLDYTKNMLEISPKIMGKKKIFCSGFKTKQYIDKIFEMHKEGVDITCVIDDLSELDYILKAKLDEPLKIGFRLNISNLQDAECDRFGLSEKELNMAKTKLLSAKKVILTTISYEENEKVFEESKFMTGFKKAVRIYMDFKTSFPTICNFGLGGKIGSYENVENEEFAKNIINYLQQTFDRAGMRHPNLIIQPSKYTINNAVINIYKVVASKQTDPKFLWYIVDGNLFSAMPEMLAGGDFKIEALNFLERDKTAVKLGGITANLHDYAVTEDKYLMLPKLDEKRPLYIGILGTGVQENIIPHYGVGAFLIPNETRYISFMKKGKREFKKVSKNQKIDDIISATKMQKEYIKKLH